MSRIYERAPREVADRAKALVKKHHPDLENAEVTIDFLFARAGDGEPALVQHGRPCLALCRIVNLRDRVKGNADAEISIDAARYEKMTPARKDALIDHELYHLIVARDDEGAFRTDDHNRPKLKIRPHDWEFGWFTEIAQRHGMDSPEVTQAQILWAEDGQSYFPMLTENMLAPDAEAKPKGAKKTRKADGEDGKIFALPQSND